MSFVAAEVLKEIVGTIASGPAGFGVHHEVTAGANLTAGSTGIEVTVNAQSLARAHAMNNGGAHKEFAAKLNPSMQSKHDAVDNKYAALFDKRGLRNAAQMALTPRPGFRSRRADMRTELSRQTPKNPLQRIRQRHFLQLRRTLDEILKKKSIAINTETLPDTIKEKLAKSGVKSGPHHAPSPAKKKNRQWALFVNPELVPTGFATD